MKTFPPVLLVCAFLCIAICSNAQSKKGGRAVAVAEAWDSVGFTQKLNAIMEPSAHSEDLKKSFQQAYQDQINDQMLPYQILKVYSLSSAWTTEYDQYKVAKFKWQQFVYVYKNTKTDRCIMRYGYLRLSYDSDAKIWDTEPKLDLTGSGVMKATMDQGFKYKTGDTWAFYNFHNQDYYLDCATLAK